MPPETLRIFDPFLLLRVNTLICLLLLAFPTLSLAWPPSESSKARWKMLVEQGNTDDLKAYITALRERGENDISLWVNMNFDSGDDKEPVLSHSPHIITSSGRRVWISTIKGLGIKMVQDNRGCTVYGALYGRTSLHIAVQRGHQEMASFLLEQGAAVDGNCAFTETPLAIAARIAQLPLVNLLLEHHASVQPGMLGPLYEAAGTGNIDIVNALLAAGADPDGEEFTGRPVFHAARYGHLPVVQRMVEAGAHVNLQNYLQETALHTAAEHGHCAITAYLLAAGAQIEGLNPDATPLSQDEQFQRAGVRRLFYDDAKDDGKRYGAGSPLNRAAGNKHLEVVRQLMKHGADISHVQPDARATLQQIYPETGGIKENFGQCVQPECWPSFALRFQRLIDSHSLLRYILISDTPVSNRAILSTTLDIPDTVIVKTPSNSRLTRIESFLTSTDFIKVHDYNIRQKNAKLAILLSDDEDKRIAYLVVKNSKDWLALMEDAHVLGAKVDSVAFYPFAHRELWSHEYESSFQQHLPATGTTRSIGKVISSKALKGYARKVPADSVYIEPDFRTHIDDTVDRDVFLFMRWHRAELARLMLAALQDHPELYARAKSKGIDLFCLGCGSGQDVMACHNTLKQHGIISRSKGIEILQPLHWNAIDRSRNELKTKFEKMTCGFIRGDAEKPGKIIRANKDSEGLTLVVAEDFLVQRVLPGTYSSLKVLQELIQPGVADMVIIGGVHPSLVSERIATLAGWKTQQVNLYHSREVTGYWQRPKIGSTSQHYVPAFVLTREDKETERERLFKRSWLRLASPLGAYDKTITPTLLDLSMTGLTERWLKEIRMTQWGQKITSIDLSYSHLDDSLLDRIVNLLLAYPSLTHVTASGYESWYTSLMDKLEAVGRLKLVQRKDNQYKHEIPSLDPDTAKRLCHYQATPIELRYNPLENSPELPLVNCPAWTSDIDSGYLSQNFLPVYHSALNQLLLTLNTQLHQTPGDGLCFFHAAAMQLQLGEGELRSILHNHILLNQASIVENFPQYAGEQFQALLSELVNGAWGDAGQAQLIAWIFNRRVILIYFHNQTGGIKIQVLNPDGQVDEPDTLAGVSGKDVILVHNGVGHWLAAGTASGDIDLQQHNTALLGQPMINKPPREENPQALYTPEIFPRLIALLISAWQTKLR